MKSFLLGQDLKGKDVRIPVDAFKTHFHLIGGTGKGKTTAIHTMLHPLLTDPFNQSCFFIIDRLGNFSQELLLWMASSFCTQEVRDRLVYVQAANEDVVPAFNPLCIDNTQSPYYRVERTTEVVLRAWESTNIEAMPRLARWTFNAFSAASHLGLTIPDCVHFLMPGSPHHENLLELLPGPLKAEWNEITGSRGSEAIRILDSSRNRLRPYFESDILRRMFGSSKTRFDCQRMMREGRIVVIDLSPRNRLSPQIANTIGALVINEVLATARSLPRDVRYPTYLFLDEFQNFVGPDIEHALPEVRQLGLRLVLSHQSLSQLERGDHDLTNMIFQAQSRMIFGVQGEDADLLAHEVASINYDEWLVKQELYSRRQLVKGHQKVKLRSRGEVAGSQLGEAETKGDAEGSGLTYGMLGFDGELITRNVNESKNRSHAKNRAETFSISENESETLVPIHDNFMELASKTFRSFQEQKDAWAHDIRNLPTGHALLRLVNETSTRQVKVKRSAPGFLGFDSLTIARRFPEAFQAMDEMVERNFKSEFFASAVDVDREAEERIQRLLKLPPIRSDGPETPPSEKTQFGI